MYVEWVRSICVGVYVCGCPGRWDRGIFFSAVIICSMDFLSDLKKIQYVCLLLTV